MAQENSSMDTLVIARMPVILWPLVFSYLQLLAFAWGLGQALSFLAFCGGSMGVFNPWDGRRVLASLPIGLALKNWALNGLCGRLSHQIGAVAIFGIRGLSY